MNMATNVMVKKEQQKQQQEHKEGEVAKSIENQTAKLPSDAFLWMSVGAMGASLALKAFKQNHLALFIGQWAAPFLLFGIYDKLVKQQGHDQTDKRIVKA